VYEIIDCDWIGSSDPQDETAISRRDDWLRWTILGYREQAQLGNPPYGERAVVLKSEKHLIGMCGLVPSFGPFGRILDGQDHDSHSPEIGLFYCMDSNFQRQGFATEAAQALIDFAFEKMKARRIVATTEQNNAASIRILKKLEFGIHVNSEAGWPEIVGCRNRNESQHCGISPS
jgi:RimJ/RimL family protein N-acetyltransferase